jgi:hypothetical protein
MYKPKKTVSRPRMESLERRQLLSASIQSLSIINASTNAVVGTLSSGQTIDMAKYSGGISIRANTSGAQSVKFGVDGNSSYKVENYTPYSIVGDGPGGDYYSWKPSVGSHTLKVTAYTQDHAGGTASATKSVTVNVVKSNTSTPTPTPAPSPSTGSTSGPAVTSYSLIDPTTNKVIRELKYGDQVDLRLMANGKSIAIRANATSATRSVKFGWDSNSSYRLESGAPYTLSGDSGGDFWSMSPSLGKHYLSTTAYSNANGTGTSTSRSISFTVIRTNPSTGSPTPVNSDIPVQAPTDGNNAPAVSFINPYNNAEQAYPGHYVVRLNASDTDGKVAKVELFVGNTLYDATADAPYSFAWKDVAAGTYKLTARVTDNDGAQKATTITVVIKNPTTDDTYYVSTSGSDSNGGSSTGSAFRTIAKAASVAGAGDTVVILPGTYRESVVLKNNGTATAPITFKAQTPGTVIIDGSDPLSGWSRDGSSSIFYTGWNKNFFLGGLRYHSSVPLTGYAEQFIYESKALTQVLSKWDLSAGDFYVDWNADRVYVWLPGNDDPRSSGSTVYGSTRQTLFTPLSATAGQFITVDGLTFRHAANFPQQPAVRADDGWVVKNTRIERMNAVAFGAYGNNIYVSNVTLANNGHTGLTGTASNALLSGLKVYGNNTKKFRWTWESGGGKMTRTDGLYVLNMNSYDNYGAGLWLDVYNTNFVVDDGYFHDNKPITNNYESLGVFIELSPGPGRVENASFYGNTGSGLSIAESVGITARKNYFADSLEIRNMENRTPAIRNISIYQNYFENAKILSSIGLLTTDSFRELNIKSDYNIFDNGSDAWYAWKGKKYYSASAAYSGLGVEQHGTNGSVTIPKA